ncbi:MAG: di-trans,poly-cis-decaprenylcistransferase [Clostridia bacterium]|nr:di-trans,poly-cis-decaprenylcistransferase [Clostridia bacterium]
MLKKELAPLPKHVAFIMDGNGRWAKKRLMPRSYGHKMAVENVTEVVEYCFSKGIKYISLFAFSTENWNRSKEEIDALFDLLRKYFTVKIKQLLKEGVRLTVMGDLSRLPEDVREDLEAAIAQTQQNDKFILNVGINYGGRDEILRACNKLIAQGKNAVTEADFRSALYTADIPDPDLVVRTSGEVRISNFMIYQMAYSELYFPKTLWPDFHKKDVDRCLKVYAKRNRRFGGV